MPSTLEALLATVTDARLRDDIARAVADLRKTTDFGLVFERHIPETVRLPQHEIRRGVAAAPRSAEDKTAYRVVSIENGVAQLAVIREPDGRVVPESLSDLQTRHVSELVTVTEFGDPIFPGLTHLDSVNRRVGGQPHILINGENYHALEVLLFSHEGKVDCIYIDPPYNSGARDWKYDNDYVDEEDGGFRW